MGQLANEVRQAIESALSAKVKDIEERAMAIKLEEETIDVTLPGERPLWASFILLPLS